MTPEQPISLDDAVARAVSHAAKLKLEAPSALFLLATGAERFADGLDQPRRVPLENLEGFPAAGAGWISSPREWTTP